MSKDLISRGLRVCLVALLVSACAIERDRPLDILAPDESDEVPDPVVDLLSPTEGLVVPATAFTEGAGLAVRWEGSFQPGQELILTAYRGSENQPFFAWEHRVDDPADVPETTTVDARPETLFGVTSVSLHLRLWSTGGGLSAADSVQLSIRN